MKTIKNLIFAALAGMLFLQASIARADDHGAQRITFQKCFVPVADEPFGGHFVGTADGDCGPGTITARYLSISPGKGIWHFSCEYTVSIPGCTFTTVCAGIVDVRTGHIILNGVVTAGEHLGAQVHVRAQGNADLSCSEGTMTITPN
jgi:hypothetical protein